MDADVAGGVETREGGGERVGVLTRGRSGAQRRETVQRVVGWEMERQTGGFWIGRARGGAEGVATGGDLFHGGCGGEIEGGREVDRRGEGGAERRISKAT